MRPLLATAFAACVAAAQAADNGDAWWRAAREKAGSYAVLTRQLDAEGKPQYVNALILEQSPYLLQHAHNPVQWQAWSDQVLARARREKRLIFVSIGYSTCHWCHVMARESFDDPGIARLLNNNYISIKIDREEHPELDDRFLRRLELLSDAPGWPMNLVLTPQGNVVAGESYLPRNKLAAMLGKYARAWEMDPSQLSRLAASIESRSRPASASTPIDVVKRYQQALTEIRAQYDAADHGFGAAPKFPHAAYLLALLDSWRRTAEAADREKFLDVLRAMARSALQDHIGGGFFRYSVSADWQSPHFEKTLYDQASLAPLFAEAWTISGEAVFLEANRATLAFVEREMRVAGGLFASAIDAESDGREGAYYLWRQTEFDDQLTADEIEKLSQQYRRAEQQPGLFLLLPRADGAPAIRETRLSEKLRALRQHRTRPFIDRKAITGRNAMMIEAFAQSGRLCNDPQRSQAAKVAMKALIARNLVDGRLHRYSMGGQAYLEAALDDFAYLLHALTVLYEIDGDTEWLERASAVVAALPDTQALKRRMLDAISDRELPSAGAVLIGALHRLAQQTGSARYRKLVAVLVAPARGGVAGQPYQQMTLLRELFGIQHVAPLRKAYLAEGRVQAEITQFVRAEREVQFEVTLNIVPGWHVNSHDPRQKYLVPTRITAQQGWEIALRFPVAKEVTLGGKGERLAVYEGTAVIQGSIRVKAAAAEPPLTLTVSAQACSERVCMPPESARLFR